MLLPNRMREAARAGLLLALFMMVAPFAATGAPSAKKICPQCSRKYTGLNFCEQDGTRLLLPPRAPAAVEASAITQTGLTLTWKLEVADEAQLLIERRTATGVFAAITRVPAAQTRFVDT